MVDPTLGYNAIAQIAKWASLVLVVMAGYYLYKFAFPGTSTAAEKMEEKATETKASRKAEKKLKRAQRKEYKIVDRIKKTFEKFDAEASKSYPEVPKLKKAFDEAKKELKQAVDWDYLIDDLEEQVEKVADATRQAKLKNELDILNKKKDVELGFITRMFKQLPDYITKSNWAKVREYSGECVKRAEDIDKILASMQALEDRIEKGAGA